MPFDFYQACLGFNENERKQIEIHRMASYRIHQSLLGDKAVSLEDYWPLSGEETKPANPKFVWGETEEEAENNLNSFLKKHKIGKFID